MTRGLAEPWHVHDSDGDATTDSDFRRTSFQAMPSVPENEFERPGDHVTFAKIVAPIDLHAHYYEGTPFVRVSINGRGLDFEVSTGDRYSIIDADVARELNLPTFGHVRVDKNSKPLTYETVIADAWVGDSLRSKMSRRPP